MAIRPPKHSMLRLRGWISLALIALFLPAKPAVSQDCSPSGEWKAISRHEKMVSSARGAGLNFVEAGKDAGIIRVREGKKFIYKNAEGKIIRDEGAIQRIQSLRIPPGYKDVWISADPKAHIQATAIDAKGRKQYRYHPKWMAYQSARKFEHMIDFGRSLPKIRSQVAVDLETKGPKKERVLAAIVRLLDRSHIRVGNEEYAKENASFGLTTFRKRHVFVDGDKVLFDFVGKSGKRHRQEVNDSLVAELIRELNEVPGENIFQYVDDSGIARTIESDEVNEYIKTISGESFTAKDFRTWGGSVAAAESLLRAAPTKNASEIDANIKAAIDSAAAELENTPAIARNNYVHPDILKAYEAGNPRFAERWITESQTEPRPAAERFVLELLAGD